MNFPATCMQIIFMNTGNGKTNEFVLHLSHTLDLKTCFSSKRTSLLHVEKYKTAVQKQSTQNNTSNMGW